MLLTQYPPEKTAPTARAMQLRHMDNHRAILIVEDNTFDAELMLRELSKTMTIRHHTVATSAESLLAALRKGKWDAVLSDYSIPGFGAMEALRLLRASGQDIPFIVVTGSIDEETAVSCLKQGVDDYILKERLTRLGAAVEQAISAYDDRRRRQALEEHLLQSQKMEAIGRLASGVVHEFNNLLSIIFVGVAKLQGTLPAGGETAAAIGMIQEAAEQAKNVTTSLLTFSHASGTTMVPVDLGGLLDDATRLFRRILPSRISLTVQRPERTKICVKADPTQLHQVLMNLAINARDAIPGEGVVSFDLSVRRARADQPELAMLVVEDNGPGMTAAVRQRAFEPFFTTKPAGEGTGLGLSIVHGIIVGHDGQISLASAPGRGTRITITIPTCPAPAQSQPQPSQRLADGGVAVLVEDNALLRGLLVTSLGALGLKVLDGRDGEEAPNLLRQAGEDLRLLVLDHRLRKSSGISVLEGAAKAGWQGPSVLITGDPNLELGSQHGGTAILRKPFHIVDFQRLCAELIAHGTPMQARTA